MKKLVFTLVFSWAAITMTAQNGPSPAVVFGDLSITSADVSSSNFAVGQSWGLALTKAPANASFALCVQANNNPPICVPNFGTTDSNGTWSVTGVFDSSTVGKWTEWLQFLSGATSSRVSFSVGGASPVMLSIMTNGTPAGTAAPGQRWVLSITGGPPNAQFTFCASTGLNAPGMQSEFRRHRRERCMDHIRDIRWFCKWRLD